MAKIYVEDVFKTSGLPTYTFVKPLEYTKLMVALRTRGRCLVIEGPSGIGKTTSIKKAIEEMELKQKILVLSARKPEECEYISALPDLGEIGIVVVDDFHVLPDGIKKRLSDFMKTLADEESENSKLILIGINKAGDSLVSFSPDLNNRIDTIRFEANPTEKVSELISLGEEALNIQIPIKGEIIEASYGSFHIAQILCNETCVYSSISDNESGKRATEISFETVRLRVFEELSRTFQEKARIFATGSRIRREGRAPYLHLLRWLSQSHEWAIQIDEMLGRHPELKLSVNQIVEKGFLSKFIENHKMLQDVIHYDNQSNILAIEDPKFLFFLRNILWNKFAESLGYREIRFERMYDFALSFAGEDRAFASLLNDLLLEREVAVFYDRNEQHRILAENVEDYLAPIYRSEAEYVIVLLSNHYPKKIWTNFESKQFRERFGEGSIIPIWFSDTNESMFDESRRYGGITFQVESDLQSEAESIVETVCRKLRVKRSERGSAA